MIALETMPIRCPYCGERISVVVDCSVESQEYTEDCEVCCQPMVLNVYMDEEDNPHVAVRTESE